MQNWAGLGLLELEWPWPNWPRSRQCPMTRPGGPGLTMIRTTETAQQRGTRLTAVNSKREDADDDRLRLRRCCLLPSVLGFFI